MKLYEMINNWADKIIYVEEISKQQFITILNNFGRHMDIDPIVLCLDGIGDIDLSRQILFLQKSDLERLKDFEKLGFKIVIPNNFAVDYKNINIRDYPSFKGLDKACENSIVNNHDVTLVIYRLVMGEYIPNNLIRRTIESVMYNPSFKPLSAFKVLYTNKDNLSDDIKQLVIDSVNIFNINSVVACLLLTDTKVDYNGHYFTSRDYDKLFVSETFDKIQSTLTDDELKQYYNDFTDINLVDSQEMFNYLFDNNPEFQKLLISGKIEQVGQFIHEGHAEHLITRCGSKSPFVKFINENNNDHRYDTSIEFTKIGTKFEKAYGNEFHNIELKYCTIPTIESFNIMKTVCTCFGRII